MEKILFLEPVFKEMIWGGDKLKKVFNFEIPSNKTGECWAISGHKNGTTKIKNGEYKGLGLDEVYKSHPELFKKSKTEQFPLLVKIIDANSNLSVQVHPDNKYARSNENGSLGKSECWYVLDSEIDTKIIIGHNAKNKKELSYLIDHNKWDEFLRKKHVKKDDFFYIPAGTVHALCEDTLVLEVQQSSDITYRLYDYDRLGLDGKKRELHIEKAKDVINVPYKIKNQLKQVKKIKNSLFTTLLKSKFFNVFLLNCRGDDLVLQNDNFLLCTVLDGSGKIEGYEIGKGDSFIITSNLKEAELSGNVSMIISHI